MTSLTNIQTTAYDITPTNLRLPSVVWTSFTYLNKVHNLWRYYRKTQIYTQPDSLAQMLAGQGMAYLIGDAYIIRIAAQCVLVATRLMDCVKQQAEVYRAGQLWLATVKGHYTVSPKVEWIQHNTYAFSPMTVNWWKTSISHLIDRIERIAWQTLEMGKQLFVLSMRIMDVMDAMNWGPTAQKDAVDESIVNIAKCLNALVSNQEELLDGLTQNKELIQRLLKGTPLAYDQLYGGVKSACEKAEMIYRPLKKVSDAGGQAIFDFGKKAIQGSLTVIGAK